MIPVEEPPIRLVAGLGNPGPEYAATRHNIGFMVVDQLAAQFGSAWEKSCKMGGALSEMRSCASGQAVELHESQRVPTVRGCAVLQNRAAANPRRARRFYSCPLGRLRLRARGGSGGHNGLDSVIAQFGTEEIPRLRIGIGAAPREGSVDYVLSRFFDEEKPIVRSTIDRAVEALKCAIDNGLVSAMNTFNKSEEI